ncbi:MAG: hypothetical protein WKF87_11940 [Chryseolinea sp.]
MKTLLAASLVILSATISIAQSTGISIAQSITIPATVLKNFASRFPDASEVIWSYNEPEYEASFKHDDRAFMIFFDGEGEVNIVKNEIMRVELPTYVNTFIDREYPGWHVGKALHIDNNGSAFYETLVEKEKESVTLVFDRTGDLLMKVLQ